MLSSSFPLFRFRVHDVSRSGFNDWPFMTVHQWGEAPHGVWELEIHNKGRYMGKWIIQNNLLHLELIFLCTIGLSTFFNFEKLGNL